MSRYTHIVYDIGGNPQRIQNGDVTFNKGRHVFRNPGQINGFQNDAEHRHPDLKVIQPPLAFRGTNPLTDADHDKAPINPKMKTMY